MSPFSGAPRDLASASLMPAEPVIAAFLVMLTMSKGYARQRAQGGTTPTMRATDRSARPAATCKQGGGYALSHPERVPACRR